MTFATGIIFGVSLTICTQLVLIIVYVATKDWVEGKFGQRADDADLERIEDRLERIRAKRLRPKSNVVSLEAQRWRKQLGITKGV